MDVRFRFGVIGFLALIAAAVWFFPTWYPLIDRDSVPNPFPGLEESAWEAFLSLPTAQQTAYKALRDGNAKEKIAPRPREALALVRAQVLETDRSAPEEEATYTPPEATPLLRTGVFRQIDVIRWASGTIAIYQLQNNQRILRLEAASDEENAQPFQTVRAPDTHVIFTRNPDPLDAAGVGVDYIDVGLLKGTVGNQTYTLPESLDFSLYPVLALYSPTLDLVISTATLR
jgi:hypothetical protein